MPVSSTDMHWWKSSVGASAGGGRTGVAIVNDIPENIYPNIASADREAGLTRYFKSFVSNDHPSDQLPDPNAWIADVPDNMVQDIGLGFDDPDDDDPASGTLGSWTGNAAVSVESDGADTRSVEVLGVSSTGTRVREVIVLTGTAAVLSAAVFAAVHAVHALATSGSRTITIRQGAAGTVRGTITPNLSNCFHWYTTATSKAAGIKLPPLPAGAAYGFWDRQIVPPGAGAVPLNLAVIAIEQA
jgi:hypothetical protein